MAIITKYIQTRKKKSFVNNRNVEAIKGTNLSAVFDM